MTTQVANNMLAFDGGAFGFRNRLINGDMRVAQRASSYALTASIAYGSADRWAMFQSTSANGVANVVTSSLPGGFSAGMQLGRNASGAQTGAIGMLQVLETAQSVPMQGQQVTFSFYAKAGVNFSGGQINVFIGTGTGTDQSAASFAGWPGQAWPVNTTQTITTSWARYSFTGTVAAAATQVGVQIQYTPSGTAGADDNIYVTGAQLEVGAAATAFEHRPYGMELALAQRYYQQLGGRSATEAVGHGFASAAAAGIILLPLKVSMRPTANAHKGPTTTLSAAADWNLSSAGSSAAVSSFTYGYSSPDVVELDISAAGSPAWTTNNGLLMRAASTTSARIKLDAEL